MVGQGEGKIKARLCNFLRAHDSVSRFGDVLFSCQCGKLNCLPDVLI